MSIGTQKQSIVSETNRNQSSTLDLAREMQQKFLKDNPQTEHKRVIENIRPNYGVNLKDLNPNPSLAIERAGLPFD